MGPLDKIMENIMWWLHSMEQGMWKAQLQQAEEMTRLGWLLAFVLGRQIQQRSIKKPKLESMWP